MHVIIFNELSNDTITLRLPFFAALRPFSPLLDQIKIFIRLVKFNFITPHC